MNTLNYIGSKKTLCPIIIDIVSKEIGDTLHSKSFVDMFAGTGSIGFRFQDIVSECIANDLEYYSFIINNALLKCNYSSKLRQIIDDCQMLEGTDGLVFQNYSTNDECERMFFSNENARKCDSIRQHIEQLKLDSIITVEEYYFMLASLLVAVDKVANTSCVYGAYLKQFKASALKQLVLVPIHSRTDLDTEKNSVYNMRAEELCVSADIAYIDPPYNQRQYSANYCPLNYIAKYDASINLTGKTGLIENYNKSDFCSKVRVKGAFKHLLDNTNCRYIFISYNSEGLVKYVELIELFSTYGALKLYKIPYKKFKAQLSVEGDTVFEYLWFIDTVLPSCFIEIQI
jgi:adenine-specific DNA-methyltransferase